MPEHAVFDNHRRDLALTGFLAWMLIAIALAVLQGCGSGNGSSESAAGGGTSGSGSGTGTGTTSNGTTQTLTGTAATGAPLVGATVNAKDSTGKTATGKTDASGNFAITVSGLTPPFMLVAVPASGSNLYSILPAMDMTVTNSQNVNVTTVTTLVMYELNGGQDPASMYNSVTFGTVTAGAVSAKETIVRSKMPTNFVNPIFSTMYGQFVAVTGGNDPYDTLLDSLGKITAMSSSGVTLTPTTGATNTYVSTASPGTGTGSATGPSITLQLTDPTTGAARSSVTNSSPALLTATVTDANGSAVPNAIVTFSTNASFGAFSGGANTALTNASGAASVTLTTPNTSGGASTVNADVTVGGAKVTAALNYSVGNFSVTLGPVTVPSGTLSAYGTASVSVSVFSNGALYTTPIAVKFTSACATSGKATLTPSVTTVNGVATASYLDNGCNNPSPGDAITATLLSGVTSSGNLPVATPSVASIQFVSVTPTLITLKGTGGQGRSESARVTFRVVDGANNALGNQLVNFSLNTTQGGLALTSASATSDSSSGLVTTFVQAGTVSTSVRVTAKAGAMSTQSDQLVVSTGIPAQDSFSLSASTHNIEGWDIDGIATTLTVRAADHFHNPVPDGTAIAFTSEGGVVNSACTTTGFASGVSTCTSTLTSQALRPTNGRVTVLARATGEETFTDLNGNGFVDNISEMIDANGRSSDMSEAFVDHNENGARDSGEPFFDFNTNGAFDGPDGLYQGLLCTSGAAICSTQKSLDVRASTVIVFSTSTASITINGGATIALPVSSCSAATQTFTQGAPVSFTVTVVDQNGNAMPAGTTVAFSTDNGTISSSKSYVVPDSTGCRTGYSACPVSAGSVTFGDTTVTMQSDASYTTTTTGAISTCFNTLKSGTFTVTVTTPGAETIKPTVTTRSATVTD